MNPLRWRKMTWALLVWTGLFTVWIIGVSALESTCAPADEFVEACRTGEDIGTGIALAGIILLWFVGFLVLSLVWMMSRPRHRQCPRCGEDVKKGRTACKKCGYEFVAEPVGSSMVASG